MYKFLSIYGPTGLTAYTSIKKEIEPFAMDNNTNKSMTIVISSAAGGMGLMLISYLTTMGYTNVYGIAGSEQKCFIAQQKGYKEVLNYKKFQSKN